MTKKDELKAWVEHLDMRMRLLEAEASKADPSYPDRLRNTWLQQLAEKVKRGESVVYDHSINTSARCES